MPLKWKNEVPWFFGQFSNSLASLVNFQFPWLFLALPAFQVAWQPWIELHSFFFPLLCVFSFLFSPLPVFYFFFSRFCLFWCLWKFLPVNGNLNLFSVLKLLIKISSDQPKFPPKCWSCIQTFSSSLVEGRITPTYKICQKTAQFVQFQKIIH